MRRDKGLVMTGLVAAFLLLSGSVVARQRASTQATQTDYTSRVPRFKFAETLAEQEAELKTNPLMLRFAASRKKMADERYRPIYHYVNPEGLLNDPNGLCFWQDRWHLFYQAHPPEDPRQHWGHAVSDDLIHWRDLPPGHLPQSREGFAGPGRRSWKTIRVIAIYHGYRAGTMVGGIERSLCS